MTHKPQATPGGPGRPGAGGEEPTQQDERSGSGMEQAMARMMAHCPCGPGMMAGMAEWMGAPPAKPADPAPPKKD